VDRRVDSYAPSMGHAGRTDRPSRLVPGATPAACAVGRVAHARLLILDGDVGEGLALLEEAGVAAVSGDLDPLSTGLVYCEPVCALLGLAQYDLAEEWTEAMERGATRRPLGACTGAAGSTGAEILRLRGSCDEAEVEALLACEELRPHLRRELGWRSGRWCSRGAQCGCGTCGTSRGSWPTPGGSSTCWTSPQPKQVRMCGSVAARPACPTRSAIPGDPRRASQGRLPATPPRD
jgi:hypothetical protein